MNLRRQRAEFLLKSGGRTSSSPSEQHLSFPMKSEEKFVGEKSRTAGRAAASCAWLRRSYSGVNCSLSFSRQQFSVIFILSFLGFFPCRWKLYAETILVLLVRDKISSQEVVPG